eukprot:12997601-Alexandrium_andersonii.AAC.1
MLVRAETEPMCPRGRSRATWPAWSATTPSCPRAFEATEENSPGKALTLLNARDVGSGAIFST